jgi:uncharacterized membrane protein (UPF0127 family)
MAGQVNVTIHEVEWAAYLAIENWELSQGLSGISSMDAHTGMFFDTGYQHQIGVQTNQMLFNLDIAFISSEMEVVEIHRDVAPGEEFTATEIARYFLEVNADEMEDVEVGDSVLVQLVPEMAPVAPIPIPSESMSWGDIGQFMLLMVPVAMVAGVGIVVLEEATKKKGSETGRPSWYER